ncbi:ATP-binding protein [Halorhodospira halochloris]|uniref:ATP-binding protein n=1 Tax=Halorhodospira halochloris TaxID=1052 RepID=UPI001EE81FD7|nr:ATP-binding protein [Halorhodospira halochloris]MCG5548790.1 ATP-binding protein [Halorhodospira halochloris]
MIPRRAQSTLKQLASSFPVAAVTGPRQSGKSTLVRALFADHPYISLEEPDQREFATEDPRGFLAQYPQGAILDEVQRCPELFSYLQGRVDQSGRLGEWILTGSQQFGMVSAVTQSLAGRVGMLTLLPFARDELQAAQQLPEHIHEVLWRGSYPPIYDRPVDPSLWHGSYVQTYLERDVRQLLGVRDLTLFQRFLRLTAGRTGQLLNQSALAEETGVSHNTIREWLSVLEASYIIHRLAPHHRNFNKRLVKTPKLYMLDSGLACWLLGIENAQQLATHPLRGALFESWVLAEHLKARWNTGRPSNISFWRDRTGREVDLVIDCGDRLQPVEIKAGATVTRDAFRGLERWCELAGDAAATPQLIYAGNESRIQRGIQILPWREF